MPPDSKPSENIIQDDEALEVWFKNREAEYNRQERDARLASKSSGSGRKSNEVNSRGMRIIGS